MKKKILFLLFFIANTCLFGQSLQEKALKALEDKNYLEAIRLYSNLIESTPSYKNYFNRGLSYSLNRQYDDGVNDLTKALELSPDKNYTIALYALRAKLYLETGENEKAENDYSKLISLSIDENETANFIYERAILRYDMRLFKNNGS